MYVGAAVGPNAASKKYDLITGLGCFALDRDKHLQRTVLRLITLITARYNWRRDELSIGRRELARLWHVDERTVKREMAKLKTLGWLQVKRPGARGRVTTYALGLQAIEEITRPHWADVGPDYENRMSAETTPSAGGNQGAKIVAMPGAAAPAIIPPADGTEWSFAAAALAAEAPDLYRGWFSALERENRTDGRLTLSAPTRFHQTYVETRFLERLERAVQAVDPSIMQIIVIAR